MAGLEPAVRADGCTSLLWAGCRPVPVVNSHAHFDARCLKAGVAINYRDRPPSSPYTTRAAIRPDRRLQTSHPGGSAYASGGHGRKTLLRTPDIAKHVEPSEAPTQNMIKTSRKLEGRDELEQSFALFSKSKPSAA